MRSFVTLIRPRRCLTSSKWNGVVCVVISPYPACRNDLRSCVQNYKDRLTTFDRLHVAFLELDIPKALRIASELDWWFVAHLADLLFHCGRLQLASLANATCDLREQFLIEYAMMLAQIPSAWRLAVDYFQSCPTFGRHLLELYVERIPFETELKHRKLLDVCRRYNLGEQQRSLNKIMGRRFLRRRRFGAALSCFMNANDTVHFSRTCDLLLDLYINEGKTAFTEFVDIVGDRLTRKPSPCFLGTIS